MQVGSPLSNAYYLNATNGSVYGLSHDMYVSRSFTFVIKPYLNHRSSVRHALALATNV